MRSSTSSVLLLLGLAAACTDEQTIGTVREHVVADPRKLDVLFVVDTSASLTEEIASDLPRLMAQLEQLPGGLPSIHIGVITTDLGIAPYEAESCVGHGDGGALQNAPLIEGCTPPEGAFIFDEFRGDGSRFRNYSGELSDVFMCVARFGTTGCGMEQPLASMRKALDGSVSKNVGFLRDDAFLAVVFLTDEDDCSASDPVTLYDPSRESEAILGPFASYRCTRFGVTCDGAELTHAGDYASCEPRRGSTVAHPDEFVEFLRSIKEPQATYVAVVAGDPTPLSVAAGASGLMLRPSCSGAFGNADPAVRLAYFAASFPNHSLSSICGADLSISLSSLGGDVRQVITSYDSDRRDDLDISYGCGIARGAGTGTAGAALLLLGLGLTCTRGRRSRSSTRSSSARSR